MIVEKEERHRSEMKYKHEITHKNEIESLLAPPTTSCARTAATNKHALLAAPFSRRERFVERIRATLKEG
jgi:hypothetical protein